MVDGTFKKVRDLQKGDQVHSGAYIAVKVVFNTNNGVNTMNINGLHITKYHPVLYNGKWRFPVNISTEFGPTLSNVYNFVLDRGHVINVNGTDCVTLGHDFEEPVVAHPYFGSSKLVLVDLMKKGGWFEGLVVFNNALTKRDTSGIVCGLV